MASPESCFGTNIVSQMLIENADRLSRIKDLKKRADLCADYARIIFIPVAARGISPSVLEHIKINFVKPDENCTQPKRDDPPVISMIKQVIQQEFGHELLKRIDIELSPVCR